MLIIVAAASFICSIMLTGCSTLGAALDTIFNEPRQKATRTPLYVYKADLWLGVDGSWFEGVGVTLARDPVIIEVRSQINLDRVEVETCARQDVCQNSKPCSSAFKIDAGWWGRPGQGMVYTYRPSKAELSESCPVFIRVYDKKALAAWGFLAFRNGEDLPAKMSCNGEDIPFAAHSVCNPKATLINELMFYDDIEEFSVDPQCHMKQIDKKKFELRPEVGLCTGKFYSKGKWHGMDMPAYDEILNRGT